MAKQVSRLTTKTATKAAKAPPYAMFFPRPKEQAAEFPSERLSFARPDATYAGASMWNPAPPSEELVKATFKRFDDLKTFDPKKLEDVQTARTYIAEQVGTAAAHEFAKYLADGSPQGGELVEIVSDMGLPVWGADAGIEDQTIGGFFYELQEILREALRKAGAKR